MFRLESPILGLLLRQTLPFLFLHLIFGLALSNCWQVREVTGQQHQISSSDD